MNDMGETLFQSGIERLRVGDHDSAMQRFRSASRYGHVGAFYNLGLQFKYGLSKVFDQSEARINFENALRLGHEKAQAQIMLYELAEKKFNDWSAIQVLIQDSGSIGVSGPLLNAIINWNISELSQDQARKYVLMELDYLSTFSMQSGGNPYVDRFLENFGIDEDEYLGMTAGGRVALTLALAANCSNRTASVLFEEVLKVGAPAMNAVYSRCVTTRLIANHFEIATNAAPVPMVGAIRFYKAIAPSDQ